MNKKERLEIGKKIFDRKLSVMDASIKYKVNYYTARSYLREYKSEMRKNDKEPVTEIEQIMKEIKVGDKIITNTLIYFVYYVDKNEVGLKHYSEGKEIKDGLWPKSYLERSLKYGRAEYRRV